MKKYLISLMLLAIIAGCKKVQTDYTETDHKIILDYIASHNLTTAQSTTSGLYYVIEKPGSTAHPNIYSTVTVNYTGRLTNDTVFDTTTGSSAATFTLTDASTGYSNVITGWQIGIPLFGRLGKGKLLIPSALGYGSIAQSGIPAHSVLIFDIELKDFIN